MAHLIITMCVKPSQKSTKGAPTARRRVQVLGSSLKRIRHEKKISQFSWLLSPYNHNKDNDTYNIFIGNNNDMFIHNVRVS